MTKRKSVRKVRAQSSEEGYLQADFKKIMGRNDKLLIGLVSGVILILLIVTGILLFGRGKQIDQDNANLPASSQPIPTKKVLTPYPSIPPTTDFTVVINERRIYPADITITHGYSVILLNIGQKDLDIVGATPKDAMLNVGVIKNGEEKQIKFETAGVYKFKNQAQKDQIGTITVR